MTHQDEQGKDICCPEFDPTPWDEKSHEWKNKPFIMESIPQFMHMPLPFLYARKINSMWKKIKDANANPELKDFLMLAHDPSPWKSELYMLTTKDVPGANNVMLSGTYLSKVFDGPYKEIRNWIREMEEYITKEKKKLKKLYLYYTTCPKCAKEQGHNYVVAFAEVE